jgi:hypothetical protein
LLYRRQAGSSLKYVISYISDYSQTESTTTLEHSDRSFSSNAINSSISFLAVAAHEEEKLEQEGGRLVVVAQKAELLIDPSVSM